MSTRSSTARHRPERSTLRGWNTASPSERMRAGPHCCTYFTTSRAPGVQTVGEWIIDQPVRHAQHIWPMDLLHSKSLQRTEVIDVSQFAPQFFKDLPIPIASDRAICLLQVFFEISLYPIVVEERVVNVKQEHDSGRFGHRNLLSALAEQLLRNLRHTLRFEPVFSQQLLQRSRRAECLHSDDAAGAPAD